MTTPYILHGFNPERILLGAEAVGLGRVAIQRAARYARERIVFDRPIGMNQGIQHPLAKCWAQVEAANLMVMKAAALFDKGLDCGVEANTGKYLAAEAGFEVWRDSTPSERSLALFRIADAIEAQNADAASAGLTALETETLKLGQSVFAARQARR